MADLSQLFGGVPTRPRRPLPFDSVSPRANEFKRKIAIGEAKQQGLSPQSGDDFYRFMGQRLFELNDPEGAQIIEQERQERGVLQRAEQREDDLLDVNRFNAATNRLNATRPAAPGRPVKGIDPETGKPGFFSPQEAMARGIEPIPSKGTSVDVTVESPFKDINKTELSKPTVNDMQGKIDTHQVMHAQLTEIEKAFDPELLTIFGKGEAAFAELADKFGMSSDAQKEVLTKSTDLATRTFDLFNAYLNQMSGAAITVQEAERLGFRLPNFGTKWWKGDGPTKFFQKIKTGKKLAKMGVARYNYLLNRGRIGELQNAMGDPNSKHGVIALESMEGIVNARIKELSGQGMAKPQVRAAIKEEFGI